MEIMNSEQITETNNCERNRVVEVKQKNEHIEQVVIKNENMVENHETKKEITSELVIKEESADEDILQWENKTENYGIVNQIQNYYESSKSNGSQGKRMRSANYTQDEKSLLLMLVQNYINIIENKKTDHVNNKDKEKAWIEIANKFNARCPNKVLRTVESLHKFYLNMKKKIRKNITKDRMNKFATGEGPCTSESSADETIFGLDNSFDTDSFIISDPIDNIVVTKDANIKLRSQEKVSESKIIRGIAVQSNKNVLENILDNDNTSSNETDVQVINQSGSKAAANLKRSISNKFVQYTPRKKQRLAATSSSGTVSKISRKYCDLADTKLEICYLQKQYLQLEIEMKKAQMRHAEEEFQLRKKLLEIQVKHAQRNNNW